MLDPNADPYAAPDIGPCRQVVIMAGKTRMFMPMVMICPGTATA